MNRLACILNCGEARHRGSTGISIDVYVGEVDGKRRPGTLRIEGSAA